MEGVAELFGDFVQHPDGLADDLADDKVSLAKGTPRFTAEHDYRRISPQSLGLNRGQRIAVLYAVGMISTGESSDGGAQVVGSETMVNALRKIRADNSIKAVVIRIDSPGGSAIASDVIWREVMLTRAVKPVIASMSDVAASGGYYIAMPAHQIVAQPATLTGRGTLDAGDLPVASLLSDTPLSDTLASVGEAADDAGSPVTAVQRLLAETAAVTLERPSDGRHLLVTAPRGWAAQPQAAVAAVRALTAVPWVTPGTLQTLIDTPAPDFAALAKSFGWWAEGPIENPDDIQDAVRRAAEHVQRTGLPALVDVVCQPK